MLYLIKGIEFNKLEVVFYTSTYSGLKLDK